MISSTNIYSYQDISVSRHYQETKVEKKIKKAKNGAKTNIYDVTHIDIGCHQDYRFVTDIEKLDKVSLVLTSFNVLLIM